MSTLADRLNDLKDFRDDIREDARGQNEWLEQVTDLVETLEEYDDLVTELIKAWSADAAKEETGESLRDIRADDFDPTPYETPEGGNFAEERYQQAAKQKRELG